MIFKLGDIIRTHNAYTTAIVVWLKPSVIHPTECFGKVIPMYNRFPLGLYETGMLGLEWKLLSPAHYLISLPEAKRVLVESVVNRKLDNLTYIEILNNLNERTKSK